VPVGEDQKQHLELARDIAQKFNNDFRGEIDAKGYADGVFFPQPEPVITGPATRVMSLRDGTKKMSKSEPSDMSRINLMDDTDAIADKIKRAKTDMLPAPPANLEELAARPEVDNLVGIYAALAGVSKEEALNMLISTATEGPSIFTGLKRAKTDMLPAPPANLAELAARPEIDNLVGIYAALAGITKEEALKLLIATSSEGPSIFTGFKRVLTEVATARLGPIRAEIVRLMGDPAEIDRVLADGAARARAVATPIMNEVKDIVGFIRS
jgi:tryptophanyl-tRNA synthetase